MSSPFTPKKSNEPAPSYQNKNDVVSMLKGEKKSMSETNYRQAPYSSVERCSECKFFEKPGAKDSPCSKVVGVVSADAVCDLFSKGKAEVASAAPAIKLVLELGNG